MTPSKFSYLAAVILAFSLASPFASAAEWVKLKSPHFELFTSQPEQTGREALAHLERLHHAFRQPGSNPNRSFPPVRVILFNGFNEFGYYSPGGMAKAYFATPRMGDLTRNFIVISGFDKESISVMNHEFSHLVSFENRWQLPIWFEEGLASFYETLEFQDGQMVTGKPHEKHLKLLRNKSFPLIGLLQLFQMAYQDRRSFPGHHMDALYVQGWAVVHMLATNPKFAPKFPDFFRAVASGEATHEALATVYQTTAVQLREDFLLHIKQPGASGKAEPVNTAADPSSYVRIPAEPWESRIVLTEVLVSLGKDLEAEREFTTMQREFPKVPEVDDAFGSFKQLRGERVMAARYYRSAIGKGSRNPDTYLHLAGLEGGGDLTRAFALLDDAVRNAPDNWQLRSSALQWAVRHRRYDKGAAYAGSFQSAPAQSSFEFHLAAGTAQLRASNPHEARNFAERARELAVEPTQTRQAEALLANIESAIDRLRAADRVAASVGLDATQPGADSAEALAEDVDRSKDVAIDDQRLQQTLDVFVRDRGGKVVDGTLKELRCGQSEALLVVATADGSMTFAIDDPSNILITRGHQHQPNHDFRCGPQQPDRVRVGYEPAAKGPRAGFLRILEFEP